MIPRAIHLIVNPAAGRGRATHVLSQAREQFERLDTVWVSTSEYRGHERELAIRAAESGARAIIVIGGDGSLSYAARGVIASGVRVPIGILAAGTGNDFAKSLGAPVFDIAATAALVADDRTRSIDAGLVDDEPFINAAGFGFDAEVLARTLEPSMMRGQVRYIVTALRHLFSFRGFEAHFVDRARDADASAARVAPWLRDRWMTLVFANGSWFGGAFEIAPGARIDDGALDCIAVHDMVAMHRIGLFMRALRGAHVASSFVDVIRSPQFTLEFPAAPRFQIDGELAVAKTNVVRVGILPAALDVYSRAGR